MQKWAFIFSVTLKRQKKLVHYISLQSENTYSKSEEQNLSLPNFFQLFIWDVNKL